MLPVWILLPPHTRTHFFSGELPRGETINASCVPVYWAKREQEDSNVLICSEKRSTTLTIAMACSDLTVKSERPYLQLLTMHISSSYHHKLNVIHTHLPAHIWTTPHSPFFSHTGINFPFIPSSKGNTKKAWCCWQETTDQGRRKSTSAHAHCLARPSGWYSLLLCPYLLMSEV